MIRFLQIIVAVLGLLATLFYVLIGFAAHAMFNVFLGFNLGRDFKDSLFENNPLLITLICGTAAIYFLLEALKQLKAKTIATNSQVDNASE